MKNKICTINSILIFILFLSWPVFASDKSHPFIVHGEQVEFVPPAGWKLAWMQGNGNGIYLAEYIPANENIDSWRSGYLAIQRFQMLEKTVLEDLNKAHVKLADALMSGFLKESEKTCDGTNTSLPQQSGTYNGEYFAISGGFCDKYGPTAPFGEGAVVAFIVGDYFVHKIEFAWRPNSKEELNENLPFRIDSKKIIDLINSMTTMSLCGGSHHPACQISYTEKLD